jgi:chromate transporter
MITFGGAYAVLPYVARQAVQHFGWLSPEQMIDGLAFAETTPGPLIMVLQFVGFLGGWNHPGSLAPGLAATLGAGITTWTTFAPSFLWILLGAPHLEAWRRMDTLSRALSAVTAVVVGVILNLGVWFGGHVVAPHGKGVRWDLAVLAAVAFLGTARWKWPVGWLVLGAGGAGWILSLARG